MEWRLSIAALFINSASHCRRIYLKLCFPFKKNISETLFVEEYIWNSSPNSLCFPSPSLCRGCSCQWSWSQTLTRTIQTKPNQTKPSKSFKNRSKEAAKLKLSAAGEDLVPEPPLQAQATGEGEGNDWDAGRGRVVATEVRNNSSRAWNWLLWLFEVSKDWHHCLHRVAVPVLVKDGKPCSGSESSDADTSQVRSQSSHSHLAI